MKSKPKQSNRDARKLSPAKSSKKEEPTRTLLHTKRPESESELERVDFNEEAWEQCCRAMAVALRRSAASPSEAHAALDRFLLVSQIKEALTLDSPVSLLQYYGESSLGVREINELERAGYLTLRAFLGASEQDLLMIRNFGGVTLLRFRALRVRLVQELGTGRPVNRLEAILKG